jgi:hypothetical protein
MSKARRLSFREDAELAIGATGAVVATDQTIEFMDSEDNHLVHLLKAGIGAAVAIGAYEMLRHAELDPEASPVQHHHPSSSSRSRRGSNSSGSSHHSRHIFEEIIGAYTLGKELLRDKKHHVAHLVGEAIGVTRLVQEFETEGKR